jgi:thiol-disulfide isomerase/thioredoxin
MQKIHVIGFIIGTFFLITANHSFAQAERDEGLHIGNILPDLTMNDPDGNPISLSDLRGNIVFVDFWASWCRPCRKENPVVVATYKNYSEKEFKNAEGFKIFSVSLDKTKDDWVKAIEDDGLIWDEHVSDLKGWRSPAAKTFNIRAIPMNYLINQDGVIIAKNLRGHQIEENLKNLVK